MFGNFFGRGGAQGEPSITWNNLISTDQVEAIKDESKKQPVLIFKHSVACGTSAMALDRLERNWKEEEMAGIKPYFLDLLSYRPVSNFVAETFDVVHQSPQALIIYDGKCVYNTSHLGISYQEIKSIFGDLETA